MQNSKYVFQVHLYSKLLSSYNSIISQYNHFGKNQSVTGLRYGYITLKKNASFINYMNIIVIKYLEIKVLKECAFLFNKHLLPIKIFTHPWTLMFYFIKSLGIWWDVETRHLLEFRLKYFSTTFFWNDLICFLRFDLPDMCIYPKITCHIHHT